MRKLRASSRFVLIVYDLCQSNDDFDNPMTMGAPNYSFSLRLVFQSALNSYMNGHEFVNTKLRRGMGFCSL